jgi:hypothetical protein
LRYANGDAIGVNPLRRTGEIVFKKELMGRKRAVAAKSNLPWDDLRAYWPDDGHGPDARVRWALYVIWRTAPTDPAKGDGRVPADEQQEEFRDMQHAMAWWRSLISDDTVQEVDVQMRLKMGGVWWKGRDDGVVHPRMTESYIYLLRWRRDGAYLESYHFNDARFGERDATADHHECSVVKHEPGLMAHWKNKKQRTE